LKELKNIFIYLGKLNGKEKDNDLLTTAVWLLHYSLMWKFNFDFFLFAKVEVTREEGRKLVKGKIREWKEWEKRNWQFLLWEKVWRVREVKC